MFLPKALPVVQLLYTSTTMRIFNSASWHRNSSLVTLWHRLFPNLLLLLTYRISFKFCDCFDKKKAFQIYHDFFLRFSLTWESPPPPYWVKIFKRLLLQIAYEWFQASDFFFSMVLTEVSIWAFGNLELAICKDFLCKFRLHPLNHILEKQKLQWSRNKRS